MAGRLRTVAHELWHICLEHPWGLKSVIGYVSNSEVYNVIEVETDEFADHYILLMDRRAEAQAISQSKKIDPISPVNEKELKWNIKAHLRAINGKRQEVSQWAAGLLVAVAMLAASVVTYQITFRQNQIAETALPGDTETPSPIAASEIPVTEEPGETEIASQEPVAEIQPTPKPVPAYIFTSSPTPSPIPTPAPIETPLEISTLEPEETTPIETAPEIPLTEIVYVTKTGTRFHRVHCQYVVHSRQYAGPTVAGRC